MWLRVSGHRRGLFGHLYPPCGVEAGVLAAEELGGQPAPVCRLDAFGPLFVAMDANGNSIYEQCGDTAQENLPAIYEKLGIKAT